MLRGRHSPLTEIVQGDLLQSASLGSIFSGISTAYYLVHSMQAGAEFEQREKLAAENFAREASASGVCRIIYLGGLANGSPLSAHMRSRAETGDILRSSGVPVVELQASIILGAGSASFELIRALVERLPAMITPRWVHTEAQPIAIDDVLDYLVEAMTIPSESSITVEIGGSDVASYLDIMRAYARERGLRRWFFAVPFLSLTLSSLWLTLITPMYASIGRRLIESVRNPSVVRDPAAKRIFHVRPMGMAQAIERALRSDAGSAMETRWSDAGGPGLGWFSAEPDRDALFNQQTLKISVPAEQAFAPIARVGGQTGWYFGNRIWRIRGFLDLMMGGVGMRRGRPDPEIPLPGTTLDFWRVQLYVPGRRLRLFAEMRVPGRAWLEFIVEPDGDGAIVRQTAYFEPRGLGGLLYWHLLRPVHEIIFRGMLRRIAAAAVRPRDRSDPRRLLL